MGSHSVTYHQTQLNVPRPALTPASKLVLDLPTPEGWKAELTYRQLGNAPTGIRTRDLSITSLTLTIILPSHPVNLLMVKFMSYLNLRFNGTFTSHNLAISSRSKRRLFLIELLSKVNRRIYDILTTLSG